jgi:pimeloyl-ACP methyl ester carboxylesterase
MTASRSAISAGPAELQDLDAVLDHVEGQYPTNGLVGIVGQSYGAGQAFQALADNPRVTTAVPMYGWVDLYEGLLPGNVPKAQWGAQLAGVGAAGTKAQVSPLLAEWLQKAATRTDLETVHAQMDARSVLDRLALVENAVALHARAEERGCLRDERGGIDLFRVQVDRARFYSREVQELVDEHGEAVHLLMDAGQELLGVAPVVQPSVHECLDHRADGGERSAQLVRDVAEEVPAHLVHALDLREVVEHDEDGPVPTAGNGHGDCPQRRPPRAESDDAGVVLAGLADCPPHERVELVVAGALHEGPVHRRLPVDAEQVRSRGVQEADEGLARDGDHGVRGGVEHGFQAGAFGDAAFDQRLDVAGHGVERIGEVRGCG